MIVGITMQQATGVGPPPHMNEAEVQSDETGGEKYEDIPERAASMPTHQPSIGATLPPQQVYVNPSGGQVIDPSIGGLETQFHALGINPEEGGDQTSQSQQNGDSSGNASAENDGEETEDDPMKLFVGQVC